jgi:RNA polymerase sigma-70 factor (ECF subfamily)
MVLVKNRHCFDPDRACESTFLARVAENKAISLVRACTAEKRDFSRNAESLNENVLDEDGELVELAQTFDTYSAKNHTGRVQRPDKEKLQLQIDVADLLNSLPDDLRRLAELLQDMREYAVSRKLGKSRRQVANDIARLRQIFEDAGFRDSL